MNQAKFWKTLSILSLLPVVLGFSVSAYIYTSAQTDPLTPIGVFIAPLSIKGVTHYLPTGTAKLYSLFLLLFGLGLVARLIFSVVLSNLEKNALTKP